MKTERFEMKISKSDKARIIRASKKASLSIASFVLACALEKTDSILGVVGNTK